MASKYEELSKDQLVDEIKSRRTAGREIKVDLRASNDALISALELDDVEGGGDQKGPEKPAAFKALENQLPLQPEAPTEATQPHPDAFADGFKAKHKGDGYTYLVLKAAGDDIKPFKARVPNQASGHPGLFWEGSPEEFAACFDKV